MVIYFSLDGKITIAPNKVRCSPSTQRPINSRSIFNPNEFTRVAKELVKFQEQQIQIENVQGTNPVVVVTMKKTEQGFCFGDKISFLNLQVRFEVKRAETLGYVGEEPLPNDYWTFE